MRERLKMRARRGGQAQSAKATYGELDEAAFLVIPTSSIVGSGLGVDL